MEKQRINEVKQLQKIAGILKETWHPDDPAGIDVGDGSEKDPDDFDDLSEKADSRLIDDEEGRTYDMTKGIALPYDGFKMSNKFKKIAKGLGMEEGPRTNEVTGEHTSDYYFVYEDDDEFTQPDFIVILNPKMQSNELIRNLVKKCLRQYAYD